MAIRSVSFATAKEAVDFLVEHKLGKEDIFSFQLNASGWYDVVYDDADPTDYAAGSGARNVDLAEGARLRRIRVQASGGDATVVILGGDTVTVKDGDTFDVDWGGLYVGTGASSAANRVAVAGAGAYYFVSWLQR